jgi:predicted RNA-binding protein with PUA-like domain
MTGTSYWIFQSNPNYYDLTGAIDELTEITWAVNQYKKQIHAGDKVYLWESGKDAGILAVATVLSDPDHIHDDNREIKFIRNAEKFTGKNIKSLFISIMFCPIG